MMTSNISKSISILGAGKIGIALATLWERKGYSVCLGSRYPDKLQAKICEMNLRVAVRSLKEAANANDIVILSAPMMLSKI